MTARRYHVTLGERSLQVEVRDADGGPTLVVGGSAPRAPRLKRAAERRFSAKLSPEDEFGVRRLRVGDRTVDLFIALNGNRCSVALEGVALELVVENQRVARLASLGGAMPRASGPAQVLAPMPGLVVRVDVQPGETVRQGEVLLALQAMKMENELASPRDAVVRAVSVQPGQAVELGQLLVELE